MERAIASIERLIEVINGADPLVDSNCSHQDYATFRKLMDDSSLRIDTESNKVVLGWQSLSKDIEKEAILNDFISPLELLVTSGFLFISNSGACCACARQQTVIAISSLCRNLLVLLKGLESKTSMDHSAHHVGAVWVTTKKLRAVAKTNAAATKRSLVLNMITVKDTTREFEEVFRSADEPNDTPVVSSAVAGSDDWYDMMDHMMDGDIDEEDAQRLAILIDKLRAVGVLMEKAAACVMSVAEPIDAKMEYIQWLDELASGGQLVETSVSAMGFLMYPPHIDVDDLEAACVTLGTHATSLHDCFKGKLLVPLAENLIVRTQQNISS